MKRLLFAAAFTIAAAFTVQEASAQRQQQQRQRINQGVRSGQLTRQEARSLQMRQAQYRQAERMAWADGRVTPRERAYLASIQRSNSRMIYNQKHDRQRW